MYSLFARSIQPVCVVVNLATVPEEKEETTSGGLVDFKYSIYTCSFRGVDSLKEAIVHSFEGKVWKSWGEEGAQCFLG